MTLDLGVGVRHALRPGAVGVVHSVFRRATYLRVGADLLALVGSDEPAGALHLRVEALDAHRVGEPVRVGEGSLLVGDSAYRVPTDTWIGPLPPPEAMPQVAEVLAAVTARLPWSDLSLGTTGAESAMPAEVESALLAGDLACLRRLLSGRGRGLTPSGDDVLAGVALAARARWRWSGEGALAAGTDGSATGDVAAAYLRWAGRGQSIEPAHDLLGAAARGDEAAAREALRRLESYGATSGADLAVGLAVGARLLPTQPADAMTWKAS